MAGLAPRLSPGPLAGSDASLTVELKMTTTIARALKDSSLLAAAIEAQGYLRSPHLDIEIVSEYRTALDILESEIRRREI